MRPCLTNRGLGAWNTGLACAKVQAPPPELRLPFTVGSLPLLPVKTEDNHSFLFCAMLWFPRLEEGGFNSHLMYNGCVGSILESLDLICEIKHSVPSIALMTATCWGSLAYQNHSLLDPSPRYCFSGSWVIPQVLLIVYKSVLWAGTCRESDILNLKILWNFILAQWMVLM